MTHCAMCHRPLRHTRPSGLGPICEKRATAAKPVERDLFGYDTEAAALAARTRLDAHAAGMAAEAHAAVRAQFKEARMALGVV